MSPSCSWPRLSLGSSSSPCSLMCQASTVTVASSACLPSSALTTPCPRWTFTPSRTVFTGSGSLSRRALASHGCRSKSNEGRSVVWTGLCQDSVLVICCFSQCRGPLTFLNIKFNDFSQTKFPQIQVPNMSLRHRSKLATVTALEFL